MYLIMEIDECGWWRNDYSVIYLIFEVEDIEGWMRNLVWMVDCDTKGELWGKLELVWFWSDFGWNILKVEVWQNSA